MPSIEDIEGRGIVPTSPYDPNDAPKFGELSETSKDVFRKELELFFDYTTSDASSKLVEAPNIQKFAIGGSDAQSLETVVQMLMSYGDQRDKFPMIAITSTSEVEKPLSIGSNFALAVQYPPRIEGTVAGPYNFTNGWELKVTTWPSGQVASALESTIVFSSLIFSDITSVTTTELVSAINRSQALYYTAEVSSTDTLRLRTGGPCAKSCPNYIEVTGGDTECLAALGITLGDSDTFRNTARPKRNRYYMASDMTINIDIVSDDINTRTELSDLIFKFFAYYMEKRLFQFVGRSYQSEDINPEEWWHIILPRRISWSGEINNPRPGGQQYDQIYAKRGSIPITIIDYIDKEISAVPVSAADDISLEEDLPQGDYFGDDYLIP